MILTPVYEYEFSRTVRCFFKMIIQLQKQIINNLTEIEVFQETIHNLDVIYTCLRYCSIRYKLKLPGEGKEKKVEKYKKPKRSSRQYNDNYIN